MDVQDTLREMWQTRPARPREGAEIAGVAAAIARRYRIDPVLVRVGFAVTAFYGIGAALYVAGWVLLPPEPGTEAAPRPRPRPLLVVGLAVAALISAATVLDTGAPGWLIPVVVVLGLLVLLHRGRGRLGTDGGPGDVGSLAGPPVGGEGPAAGPAGDPAGAPTATIPQPGGAAPPAWDPLGAAPFAWDLPEPSPPAAPARRRPPVTAVTLAAALVAGGVATLSMLVGGAFDLPVLLGVVLAVLGTGLVVGAFLRTGRGLIPVAVLVGVLTWAVLAAPFDRWHGEVGDVVERPAGTAAVAPVYEHGAGAFLLDLRDVDLAMPPGTPVPRHLATRIEVGAGRVEVLLPPDADLTLRADAGLGSVRFGGRESAGPGASLEVLDDLGDDGERSGRELVLDIEVGAGDVEVRRG